MATIVTGDLYYELDGKLAEIKRQLRQKNGYPFNPHSLNCVLRVIVEGRFGEFHKYANMFSSHTFAADLIPEYVDKDGKKCKWKVDEDVEPSDFQMKNLEFVSFLRKGQPFINGADMRLRAVSLKANLGLADAKYILDHQTEVPAKLRGKGGIVLPGTLLCDPDGNLRVPCLFWGVVGRRWDLSYCWLAGFDWHSRHRLARCK